MTEIAGLQQGEFNFSEPPPVGGPDLTTPSSQPAFNPVLQSLTKFERQLTDRERQFRVLERSEEHTSELQSLMRISYAVFCLKKKNNINHCLIMFCSYDSHCMSMIR